MRRRAEQRLEKAVEDLSRLLSTDAQAGSVLSQRVNALTEVRRRARGSTRIEADLAVLGTVVRQVTETVAELEERRRIVDEERHAARRAPSPTPTRMPEPVIPLEMLRQAVEDKRRRLPHRADRHAAAAQAAFATISCRASCSRTANSPTAPDFMPRHGGEDDRRADRRPTASTRRSSSRGARAPRGRRSRCTCRCRARRSAAPRRWT